MRSYVVSLIKVDALDLHHHDPAVILFSDADGHWVRIFCDAWGGALIAIPADWSA